MENPVLQAERRAQLGTRAVRRLRREGKVPAILYGHKEDTLPLSIPEKDFETALQTGVKMFRIHWDNNEQNALLKEMQYDTFGSKVLHADFIRVAMDEEVTLEVSIELRGTPVGATKGGVLEQMVRAVYVKCLPTAIPDKLATDVSKLDVGERLALKDLVLPSGVKVVHDDLDATVAQVKLLAVEEEAAPAEEEKLAKEPEVITKKAKEGEEEEEKEKKS
ncbi:MAG: 50S ribosomal protein L25 [Candidatus Brocadiales bacterium]